MVYRGIAALCCLLLWPLTAGAEVKVRVGEDGVPFIYEETEEQHSLRLANELRPVPRPEMETLIRSHAQRHGLSSRLVQAVIQVESGYNPRARSHKGAMGLMQLMPDTARLMKVSNPYDPDENIRGGTLYLRRMLDRFANNVQLALAAYNAGPSAVDRFRGIPPYRETRDYVGRVMELYRSGGEAVSLPGRGTFSAPAEPVVATASADTGRDTTAWSAPVAEPAGSTDEPPPARSQVFIVRDANNRILITSEPPGKR